MATLKCASVENGLNLTLLDIKDHDRNYSTSQWNFLDDAKTQKLLKPNDALEYYMKGELNIDIPSFVVEIAIICDKEFSERFDYDRLRIEQYWMFQLRDLTYQFQTLRSSRLSFTIASVGIIKNATDQPFIESSRNSKGHTKLSSIRKKFSRWLYQNKTLADVVLLVTGSLGKLRYNSTYQLACGVSHDAKQYNRSAVLRSAVDNWHDWQDLAVLMATMLGARLDEDTDCIDSNNLMALVDDLKDIAASSYHFSQCSDADIHQFLMSEEADCLTSLDNPTETIPWTNDAAPFTGDDMCYLQHNSTTMSVLIPDCVEITCYDHKTGNEGDIYPIYGTPCGTNKSCFRGACLSKGFLLRHKNSANCLQSLDAMWKTDFPKMKRCPMYPSKFDEYRIEKDDEEGVYLKMSYTDMYIEKHTEKCLAVSDDIYFDLQFDECPSPASLDKNKRFKWDLIKIDSNTPDFLLCSRAVLKCLSFDTDSKFRNWESLNQYSDKQTWNFVDYNSTLYDDNIFTNLQAVAQHYSSEIKLKLALFYDIECIRLFNGNIQQFLNYWISILEQLMAKFAHVTKYDLGINIALLEQLEVTYAKQMSKTPTFNNSTNLNEIARTFRRWAYKNSHKMNNSNVAVFVTGTPGNDRRSVVSPNSACNINHLSQEYLSSIVLRIGMSDLDWCDEELRAFGILLGTETSNREPDTPQSDSISKTPAFNCSARHHVFSSQEIDDLNTFLESREASCLRISGGFGTTKFLGRIPKINLSAQCHLFSNDSSTYSKREEANCKVVNCYRHNGTKEAVVRQVYPFEFSSCEDNKRCFGGNCDYYGFQLQNVAYSKCLVSTKSNEPNDIAKLQSCLDHPTPYQQVSFTNGSIVVPWMNIAESKMEYKCLIVDNSTETIAFSSCLPKEITVPQWRFIPTIKLTNTTFELILYHILTSKCLSLNSEFSDITMDSTCEAATWSRWKMHGLPTGHFIDDYKNQTVIRTVKEGNGLFVYLITIIPGLITAVCLLWIGWLIYKRKQQKILHKQIQERYYLGELEKFEEKSEIMDQSDLLAFDRSWEFPLDRLKFERELGSGAFGRVVMAVAQGLRTAESECLVAVKTLQKHADTTHFVALKRELKMLAYVGHHDNLVNLLGACTKYLARNKLWIVLEYCKYGSLRCYLLRHKDKFVDQIACTGATTCTTVVPDSSASSRPSLLLNFPHDCAVKCLDDRIAIEDCEIDDEIKESPFEVEYDDGEVRNIKTSDLLCWSYQIAKGMDFLTTKRVLHGDLAARNILLTENNVVKICDFGFASELRKNYEYNYKKDTKGVMLPIKWMAIESLEFGIFSAESDCWSFGVLLWELFTLGKNPYPGLPTNETLIKRLKEGYRMDKPDFAPSRVYDIMLQCWAEDKSLRPKFFDLVTVFRSMLDSNNSSNYTELEPQCETEIMPALNNKEVRNNGIICQGVLKRYHSDEHLSLVCCKKDNSGFRKAKSLVNLNGFQL